MNANDAMKAAQSRYDNELPDDTPDFLDTPTGSNWLESSADWLMSGQDYKLSGRVRVPVDALHDLVGKRVLACFQGADATALGWLMTAIDLGDAAEASSALREITYDVGETVIREAALELLKPLAKEAEQEYGNEE